MAVLDKLQLIAPGYATLTDVSDWIDLADAQVASGFCQRELAVAYLAAHSIAMSDRGASGGAGSVTSLSEGDLSVSYGNAMGSTSNLSATTYGQEFERIKRACAQAMGFVMRTF